MPTKHRPPVDLLNAASGFAFERKLPLTAPDFAEAFAREIQQQLTSALDDKDLIRGLRAENLFRAIVVSLGRIRMIKPEDVGPFVGSETMAAPDFRVILETGENWLVEVKHVYGDDPLIQVKSFTPNAVRKYFAYAEAVGTEWRLAIYWSKWNLWTIVDPRKFVTTTGGVEVDMCEAMKENEFEKLGDVQIGTLTPLRLVIGVDRTKPHTISPDGRVDATLGENFIFAGDLLIRDEAGRNLAMLLIEYEGMPVSGPQSVMENEELVGIEFVGTPERHDNTSEEFTLLGPASRIFSNYFLYETRDGKDITQLHADSQPTWFEELPVWHTLGRPKSDLPLWLFRLIPPKAKLDEL